MTGRKRRAQAPGTKPVPGAPGRDAEFAEEEKRREEKRREEKR